jgi:hypothetical protein
VGVRKSPGCDVEAVISAGLARCPLARFADPVSPLAFAPVPVATLLLKVP